MHAHLNCKRSSMIESMLGQLRENGLKWRSGMKKLDPLYSARCIVYSDDCAPLLFLHLITGNRSCLSKQGIRGRHVRGRGGGRKRKCLSSFAQRSSPDVAPSNWSKQGIRPLIGPNKGSGSLIWSFSLLVVSGSAAGLMNMPQFLFNEFLESSRKNYIFVLYEYRNIHLKQCVLMNNKISY